MKAIILAGGKGTRLLPYTALLPKPLMPIDDMPVLELLLRQFKQYGVVEVVLAVNHLHHLIRSFFGDGSAFGLKITYAMEDKPLGTAGPLAACLDQMSPHFLACNGDLLTNLDFAKMAKVHVEQNAAATIATHDRHVQMEFGALTLSEEGHVTEYSEKPSLSFKACMGMYVLDREKVRPHHHVDTHLDMPDLMRRLMGNNETVHSYAEDCIWLDIGRPEDYAKAQEMFSRDRSVFLGSEGAQSRAAARPISRP
jgi:NDP-sugar pyrophosphorylase family protein